MLNVELNMKGSWFFLVLLVNRSIFNFIVLSHITLNELMPFSFLFPDRIKSESSK